MSGFSADWLALRESADDAARSAALVETVRAARRADQALEVVDLGAGTGANFRYLAPRLGGRQRWLLVDDDRVLLESLAAASSGWARAIGATLHERRGELGVEAPGFSCAVCTRAADLSRGFEHVVAGAGLVTASALLDLVSAPWLESLADACRQGSARVLFALSYDGRMTLEPGDPDDAFALDCFNRHQRGIKTFGRALGPDAVDAAPEAFAARGYSVASQPSDWRLTSRERRLQAEVLTGWAGAAAQMAPGERERLERWHARRRADIEAGRTTLVVGHRDFAGRPAPGDRG